MRLFTSSRERRLWLGTLLVVTLIYSTLGYARTLSDVLRSRGLLDVLFASGFILVSGAVVIHGLRSRPGWGEIGFALGMAGIYVMTVTRLALPEERTHLFEYGLVAVLIHQALLERKSQGGSIPAPAVVAVVATGLLGWLDEGIQGLLPERVYDMRDVGFNALAGLMAVSAVVGLTWLRDRRMRQSGR